MEPISFFNTGAFKFIILPLLIFIARITDVSIGTMRVIFISKGYKLLAALCGFFEVLIWIIAITQILKNITNPLYYIAYASGFATGNFVGMIIEEKIALGHVLIRVITPNDLVKLTDYLKEHNFGLTFHDAEGLSGTVKILFTIIPRIHINQVISFIKEVNPQAFYTVEDIRLINEKSLSYLSTPARSSKLSFFRRTLRKGK